MCTFSSACPVALAQLLPPRPRAGQPDAAQELRTGVRSANPRPGAAWGISSRRKCSIPTFIQQKLSFSLVCFASAACVVLVASRLSAVHMPAPVATSSVALAASGALRRGALLLRRTGGAAAAGSGAHRPQPPQQRSCASARTFHVSVSAAADEPSSSGQQLPRFFTESPLLNVGTGMTVQLTAEEGKHARKVLRLKPGAPVELCDGEGRVARAQMLDGAREVTVLTTSAAVEVPWEGPRWVVAAACGSLKGGRADWCVPISLCFASRRKTCCGDYPRVARNWRRVPSCCAQACREVQRARRRRAPPRAHRALADSRPRGRRR